MPKKYKNNVNYYLQKLLYLQRIVYIIKGINFMLSPNIKRLLAELGENIKMARLRRKLSTQQVAERAGISRPTLSAIEKGKPNVSIGMYAQVLFVLRLAEDLQKVASDDELGRKLQDAKLIVKERAPKRKSEN
jgi:DNA-binding XRE family transcriptional regulator